MKGGGGHALDNPRFKQQQASSSWRLKGLAAVRGRANQAPAWLHELVVC
jgi:hypothetical protein